MGAYCHMGAYTWEALVCYLWSAYFVWVPIFIWVLIHGKPRHNLCKHGVSATPGTSLQSSHALTGILYMLIMATINLFPTHVKIHIYLFTLAVTEKIFKQT